MEEIKTNKESSVTATGTPTEVLDGTTEEPSTSTVDTGIQEEEKVSVTRKFLEDIQRTLEAQQADIGFLKSVADKKSVALYHQRNKGRIPTEMKIRTMDILEGDDKVTNKVIVGWRTLENEAWLDDRKEKAIQTVLLMYQDRTTQKMSLVDFNRRFKHVNCTKVGTITDEKTGMLAYKLIRKDTGEEVTIGATFVN